MAHSSLLVELNVCLIKHVLTVWPLASISAVCLVTKPQCLMMFVAKPQCLMMFGRQTFLVWTGLKILTFYCHKCFINNKLLFLHNIAFYTSNNQRLANAGEGFFGANLGNKSLGAYRERSGDI